MDTTEATGDYDEFADLKEIQRQVRIVSRYLDKSSKSIRRMRTKINSQTRDLCTFRCMIQSIRMDQTRVRFELALLERRFHNVLDKIKKSRG